MLVECQALFGLFFEGAAPCRLSPLFYDVRDDQQEPGAPDRLPEGLYQRTEDAEALGAHGIVIGSGPGDHI